MKAVQFLNALTLLQQRVISFRCLRVYLGCFAVVAIRDAARRAGRSQAERRHPAFARYRVREIARLCGATERQVASDLAALRRAKLLQFDEHEIKMSEDILPETVELSVLVRSPTRPVPVPRAVLRFLASERRSSVSKTMIAYMLRGLTITKTGAEISGRGSAKLSWICAVAGLSERAGRYARAELIRQGWIGRDTGSYQRKLNQDGAYFSINLDWFPSANAAGKTRPAAAAPFAVRSGAKPPVFAPLKKDGKTPYGSKNQKTSSGVSTKPEGEEKLDSHPSLQNVVAQDLFYLSRCEALYWQAVAKAIISHSEMSALNFLAAAVRARSITTGDPARVFITLIRRKLWHHITSSQEDVARRALARIRNVFPNSFRTPSQIPQHPRHAV